MKYYYRICEKRLDGLIGKMSQELTEFTSPTDKPVRTICAMWCNLMEQNYSYFKECETDNTQIILTAFEEKEDRLIRVYSIGNIPSCRGVYKIITLEDIGY